MFKEDFTNTTVLRIFLFLYPNQNPSNVIGYNQRYPT